MTDDKQKKADDGINTKHQKAIAALLSERTIGEAAKRAGVGERTLYTWLADPAFRDALREAERGVLDDVTRRLTAGQRLALDTLEKLIQSARHESTKLTACVQWLNLFVKYRDMQDIDQRLTALEAAINGNKK
jgi:hypothetical protein